MTANLATQACNPILSVVIPVYNEEDGLQALFDRLYPALDVMASKRNITYEVVFVNDGSKDRSAGILAQQVELRPDVTRAVLFHSNFGQHMAIMAGFECSRGEHIITLDADLQNPPEEIDALVNELLKGHDYVGTIRADRRDSFFRKFASRAMNHLRQKITRITMTDQGCMLRGYSRRIVDLVRQCDESNTFIPALAYTFASNPTEITVKHEERFAGESKYSLYQLIRLNFDLVTGFSVMPLQIFSILGMLLAMAAGSLFIYLLVRRFVLGAEVEGVFTLFALTFFLIGVMLFGLGLLGEYIGRIYQQVRERPRYVVQTVLEKK
ncbi:glycosyltransferase [Polynucleobacter corsicus]|uniref:glycosyltransferase n=1 Tax=Polynucleobacter corsicus TaxID=2081042 RepID=UPI001BFECBBC|nr:glycosyltransferase [Polynucleobacter corsicus]QWE18151.1 glycosyltransferase [Polynucleobacter corsicus]